MKILITTDLYEPLVNGVITSLTTLRQALQEKGHDVRVLTLGDHSYYDEEKGVYFLNSVSVDKIYPGARISVPGHRIVIDDVLAWEPDVVHSQSEFSAFYAAKMIANACDIPLIHTYHTAYEDYTHYFAPNEAIGSELVGILSRWRLKEADEVIVPSIKVKRMLQRYHIDQPVNIIPTGLCLDRFNRHLSDDEKQKMRRQFNIPSDHLILISIGRLGKEKNLQEIVDYIHRLDCKNVSMIIVGDGPYRESLEGEVETMGLKTRIHFTGAVSQDEVVRYYQLGDIFVSGSTSETQGLTYIEALASGTPAICRKDSVLEDVIIPGWNGYQYDDFKSFAMYLDCLSDRRLREAQGRHAKRHIEANYSAGVFADKVYAVYEHALTKRPYQEKDLSRGF